MPQSKLNKLQEAIIDTFRKFIGYCDTCVTCRRFPYFKYPKTRRQHTAYVDDKMNFFTGCIKCHEVNDRYWEDMWEEYNLSR